MPNEPALSPERRKLGVDRLRQPIRRGAPRRRQRTRRLLERRTSLELLGAEPLACSLLVLERLELGGGRRPERDDRLQRVAVLASQVVEQCQPLLRGGAAGGIEVDAVGDVASVAGKLGCLGRQRGRTVRERREPIVVLRRGGEAALGAADGVPGPSLVTERGDRLGR